MNRRDLLKSALTLPFVRLASPATRASQGVEPLPSIPAFGDTFPDDLRFVKIRQISVQQIARWYNIPAHLLVKLQLESVQ